LFNAFIKRDLNKKSEKHNKMLQSHKIFVFDNFISSLLKHEILFINKIIFIVIMKLKRVHRRQTSFKNDFEIHENKIIFMKSKQNYY
jgi:hypothetical protein